MIRQHISVLFIIVVAMTMLSCSRAPSTEPDNKGESRSFDLHNANVLLITVDTTRADRLGAYGYADAETPRMDRLAKEGALFEQAITPTAYTFPSHSSIMTGLYPPYHGVRLNGGAALADVQTTLAEQLGGAGYRCGAFVGAFVLDQRWGLNQGFDHYDDDFEVGADQRLDLAGVQRPANDVVDAALGWLGEDEQKPFFAWLHFYDPHTPYDPPEPYRERFAAGGKSTLYDGEIAFTDSQVGRMLDWLEERGIAENTVVVVVGDHGEALGGHGEQEHGFFIYDDTVRVPLIVKAPGSGITDTRVTTSVRTVDVAPTVLDLVGVDALEPSHGESLVDLMLDPQQPGPEYAYCESMAVNLQYGWSALYSIRTSSHKYIDAPRAELYDVSRDPEESQNRLSDEPDLTRDLQAALTRIREEIERGAPEAAEANLDDETLSMLASLGYVGGPSVAAEGDNLADPKDKIHLYESIGFAAHLMAEEDFERSTNVLEIVLNDDPDIPQAKLLLATSYQKTNRIDEAKAVLDAYLRDNPDSASALVTMANILFDEGSTDEVMALAKRVLSVDDRNTQAYELMAKVAMATEDHASALPMLEKAIEIQPKLTRNRLNLVASYIGLGRLAEAEPMLRAVLDEYPKFPLAHFHLGLLYEQQNRMTDARDAYGEELALYSNSMVSRFNLGNLLFRLGDAPAAETQMRTLIEQAPETPRPYLFLARMMLKTGGDLGEIEGLAKSGLQRTEADDLKVLGNYLLADVYSRQGRQAELEKVLERATFYRARVEGAKG